MRLSRWVGNRAVTELIQGRERTQGPPVQRVVTPPLLTRAAELAGSTAVAAHTVSDSEPIQRVVSQALLDAAAGVLQAVPGGNVAGNIVVVPNGVPLGTNASNNHAITIKLPLHVTAYRKAVSAHEADFASPELCAAVAGAITLNTIVIHEQVMEQPEVLKCATIWHELGHVLHGRSENGLVFAHELSKVRERFGDAAALQHMLTAHPGGAAYYAGAQDPGRDVLAQIMSQLQALGAAAGNAPAVGAGTNS